MAPFFSFPCGNVGKCTTPHTVCAPPSGRETGKGERACKGSLAEKTARTGVPKGVGCGSIKLRVFGQMDYYTSLSTGLPKKRSGGRHIGAGRCAARHEMNGTQRKDTEQQDYRQ